MMKALFVHDHKFRRINGRIYSPGGLPDDVMSRYADWFGSIVAVGRVLDEMTTKPNYSEITNPNVTVITNERLRERVQEADCVIARLPSINGYKAVHFAKKFRKPYLVEVVGCTFDAYWNYDVKGKLMAIPAFLTMRHYVKKAPYALYVTSVFLQKRYPCAGKTIGVSDVEIEAADKNVLEKRLQKIGQGSDTLILGTAGAIDVAYKGQEYVIRAIPMLEQKIGKTVRYELAGVGNPERLQRIAEDCGVADKVVFLGVIPHKDMFAWLDSIDIYVQSSMLEGLSRAVVEAMSRGLPCIAADKGGNPELLEKSCLFSVKRKHSIPQIICGCLASLSKADTMRRSARRNYELANGYYARQTLEDKRYRWYKAFAEEVGSKPKGII